MRIRMLVEMSGSRNGQDWPARGEVAELPTAEAAHLVAAGVAEAVSAPEEDEPPEAAVTGEAGVEKRPSGRKPRTTRG